MSSASPARARVGSRSHLTQPQPMAAAAPGLGPLSSASGTGSHGTGFGSAGPALATSPLGMPLAAAGSAASAAAGKLFAGVNVLPTMDFEVAMWQMVHVLFSQQRAYRDLYLHKQTKNQWARDDPAFVVIMVGILSTCAVLYGVAYGLSFPRILRLIVSMVLVDFVLVGIVVSTLAWLFCNRFLRVQTVHSVEQKVEWAYAFDVHCNGFVPILLLLYLLQFFFLPILTKPTFLATLLGNTLYFVALSYYQYITFLGYSALPFLQYTETFLLPCGIYVVLYVVSLFFVNISSVVLKHYLVG